eukprot:GEMP01015985.1.p1 GENE.GEMP01015985.1~~GEMP01015985.1.p1  ORF type:complete len:530 (+),score=95.83 GEMP01015985.1:214-1803(+)
MLRWLSKDEKRETQNVSYSTVTEGLCHLYKEKLKPLEDDFFYHRIYAPPLASADFTAKPMILMMGQYSTGKSTFIRHLLERDYPGLRIGPEPTTDKFVCVLGGPSEQVVPGNAVVVDPSLPFTQLSEFGVNFFDRLEASILPSPVLEGVTFIDTPGVLSGEKQRVNRGYDFEAITKWFADRVDMIILLFDAHKLDISDEFHRVINALQGNTQKVRIVLNKADRVSTQQLMRVYGALMWSLGKVLNTPEVARIYIGSFWDETLYCDEQRKLFEMEENDLYTDISLLPKNSALRHLNDVIKRARLARVNACILNYMRSEMPSMFGRETKQKKLLNRLPEIFKIVSAEHGIPMGDFPDPAFYQQKLESLDFTKIPKLSERKLTKLKEMLEVDIPRLLKMLPQELAADKAAEVPFMGANPSPFAVNKCGGENENTYRRGGWMNKPPNTELHEEEFNSLCPEDGKVDGSQAKSVMINSKLPSGVLHKIWNLADADKDGCLTLHEFANAKHFIAMKLDGQDLPTELPDNFRPPRY